MYGNGGLKLWTRKFVNEMKTHENSDPTDVKGKVEFCFDERYYQFNECYSESFTNATPFQAWRAGFREGVKMSLDQGAKIGNLRKIWWQNYERLLIWCNIGADVTNGFWSMLGAREGAYLTNCTEWDYANVRDFEWLTEYWNNTYVNQPEDSAIDKCHFYGSELATKCKLEIANLEPDGSQFFKTVYRPTQRIIRTRV
jgi:hypothetical protein